MNHNPLFSIVTVCYNSEKTIARTIESVLTQEFKDYEYIIVDGNSKDKTLDIIRKYEPKFEGRMKIKSEPDKGIYDAFNKGIQRSNGIYIWIVNSDDYIEPQALKELAQLIESFPEDNLPIIASSMRFINLKQNTSTIYISNEKAPQKGYKSLDMGIIHPATLVPKSIYKQIGNYDDRFSIMADIDWFIRACKTHQPIYSSTIVSTNMCYGGISTTSQFKKLYKERTMLYKKHTRNLIEEKLYLSKWYIRHFKNTLYTKIKSLKHK